MAINILIVDDSKTIRAILAKTLKLSGIDIGNIYQASNGKEALEYLNDNWIDLVLSDLNMPVMSGFELIDKMFEDDLLSKIPVIVISTEGNITRIETLKKKGIKNYVRKPFIPESIGEIISEITGVACNGT